MISVLEGGNSEQQWPRYEFNFRKDLAFIQKFGEASLKLTWDVKRGCCGSCDPTVVGKAPAHSSGLCCCLPSFHGQIGWPAGCLRAQVWGRGADR